MDADTIRRVQVRASGRCEYCQRTSASSKDTQFWKQWWESHRDQTGKTVA